MIIAVKRTSKKRLIIKVISIIAVIFMFIAYYFHMSDKFAQDAKQEQLNEMQQTQQAAKENKKNKIEKIIYREVENAVDLVGQLNVRNVKIIANKIVIVCDPNTNIDALVVRYGTMALVKRTIDDIKIAIDLKYVVESKYDENN
ncbi:hypothetical protein CPU12_08730 [Malaciobacter molluscorum LMG 25693]|uniref:Uncharacterized protein n=1 Tax=Malaciobacter molluscorum LMG 25693 TaxID=870501 RepID=A0A2G1DH73_9BACT|nr:hypothetical protein [Malaciobacter molluscorum]AXX93431.1 hypothetical protein AMOL_2489 [Malaciobacter molluscorum LMG 25693]PHO17833.1 hypothetical protein CPU12_08730 [Malaciobacter molluscorum LMG 25693]RXJ95051.1 hypothetical protein CRV00_04660 [Malaciobacter molluscorum]